MKKYMLFLTATLFLSAFAFSQTKLIAHRSHSGKNNTFSILGYDNFGLPPGYKAKKDTTGTKTDSLKNMNQLPVTRKKKIIKKKTAHSTAIAVR